MIERWRKTVITFTVDRAPNKEEFEIIPGRYI